MQSLPMITGPKRKRVVDGSVDAFVADSMRRRKTQAKQRGEVFTPVWLVEQMLDKLPKELWTNKNLRWLDPAAGFGIFPICVHRRLMRTLKAVPLKRRSDHIVKNMLFMAEIDDRNVRLLREAFGDDANVYHGDSLQYPQNDFDVVVGNPPYQPYSTSGRGNGGKALWPEFVRLAFRLLRPEGYLAFVHPPGWRAPQNSDSPLRQKQFLYLSMHSKREGQKTFGAITRYDWYVLKNAPAQRPAPVRTYDGKVANVSIHKAPFIANYGLSIMAKLAAKAKAEGGVPMQRSYRNRMSNKHMSKEKSKTFSYPQVKNLYKGGRITLAWSAEPHKYQHRKKVICSRGENLYPRYDNGVWGVTDNPIFALVDTQDEGRRLAQWLDSPLMRLVVKATKWSNFEVQYKMFEFLPRGPVKLNAEEEALVKADANF